MGIVDSEEEMDQGIKNAAGIVSGEIAGGLNGNDDQPQDCGDPGLQDLVSVRAQAGRGRSKSPPCRKKRDKDGAPRVVSLDGIVGSLARDHDIVYVALAQSGAADADETRLLQQLGDG